jgi:hypothetical protein
MQHTRKIEKLEKSLTELQQDKHVGEALLYRQLIDWKHQSHSFEEELQTVHSSLHEQTQAYLIDRNELNQQIETLETENKKLIHRQMKDNQRWEHEKRLHKKIVQSLEQRLSKGLRIELEPVREQPEEDMKEDFGNRQENSKVDTTLVTDPTLTSDASPSRVDVSIENQEALQERIKYFESELESRQRKEASMNAQLAQMAKRAELAENDAGYASRRIEVLQTYLDVSMSSSLSKSKELQESLLESSLLEEIMSWHLFTVNLRKKRRDCQFVKRQEFRR